MSYLSASRLVLPLRVAINSMIDMMPVSLVSPLFRQASPLEAFDWAALAPDQLGPVTVVAPHPDDESLGCGGLIASARDLGLPIRVVVVSDGEGSHRRSRRYPPVRLGAVRRGEVLEALAILGVPAADVRFLGQPDRSVPHAHEARFITAVDAFVDALRGHETRTLVMPWRRDPSADHRAAWGIAMAGLGQAGLHHVRRLEYPVWLWRDPSGLPSSGEVLALRLDIRHLRARKRAAIAAHRSQVGHRIMDDPTGFHLSRRVLAAFDRPYELYFVPVG